MIFLELGWHRLSAFARNTPTATLFASSSSRPAWLLLLAFLSRLRCPGDESVLRGPTVVEHLRDLCNPKGNVVVSVCGSRAAITERTAGRCRRTAGARREGGKERASGRARVAARNRWPRAVRV